MSATTLIELLAQFNAHKGVPRPVTREYVERCITLVNELAARLRVAEDALQKLVGHDGCLGWLKNHPEFGDSLLFRGGRIDANNSPNPDGIREAIDTLIAVKIALDAIDLRKKWGA